MMRRVWTRIRRVQLSVQSKLILCLLGTVILPLTIIIPVLQVYKDSIAEEEIRSINQERAIQTTEQIEMIYKQINSASNLLFWDDEIERILRDGYNNYSEMKADNQKIIEMQKRYDKATMQNLDLHVTIISNDNRIYGNGTYNIKNVPFSEVEKQWWYQQIEESPWQTLWVKDSYLDELHGMDNLNYIYSVRLLKRFDNWENHGVLIVSFLERDLVKLYANTVPKLGSVFVVNRDGSIISMVDNADLYSTDFLSRIPDGYSVSMQENIRGMDYQVVANTVSGPLWQVIIATPNQQLRAQFRDIAIIPVLTALFLIVLIAFSLVVTRYIIKPIRILTANVQKIGLAGILSQRINVSTTDEVGILSMEFNHLLERIDELMVAMVNEQTAKREAELQALYSQINPHFIYNTLTSIRALIISGDIEQANKALHDFTIVLRYSISNKEELWTIQQELELLKKYLDIQQMFFDEPFTVVWDIAPEVRLCKIIRLSLQPIAENAVMHGLRSKHGHRELKIRIISEGDNIRGSILDNGVGTDKIISFDEMSKKSDKNIGLKNVHSRFILYFGEGYGLEFSSFPGQGTEVQFLMPKVEEKEEIM